MANNYGQLQSLIDKVSGIKQIESIGGYPVHPSELIEAINLCCGDFDIDYLSNIDSVMQKRIDCLTESEIATYMTFILRGERFCVWHTADYLGKLPGLFFRLGKI